MQKRFQRIEPQVFVAVVLSFAYLCCQMVADVSAAKIFTLFGLSLPAGSFIYALTFTLRDLVHKRLGRDVARLMIVLAGIANVFMAGYFMFVRVMPYPPYWLNQAAYDAILGVVPRIVVASIVAEIVSELTDTELYHLWVTRVTTEHQWSRVVVSNLISCPLDSVMFGFGAFYGILPTAGIWALVWGQSVFKWALTAVSLPSIYLYKEGSANG